MSFTSILGLKGVILCHCLQLNNSDSGLFTVFTRVKDFSRIHLVDKWNGVSKVKAGGDSHPVKGAVGVAGAGIHRPERLLLLKQEVGIDMYTLLYLKQVTNEDLLCSTGVLLNIP